MKEKSVENGTISNEITLESNNGAAETNNKEIKNWKDKPVTTWDGHEWSSRDPDISEPPIYEAGPFSNEQREGFLGGNSGDTKLAPHHRHQIPVGQGGVIDEIPGPRHPEGNIHTKGSPTRHPGLSYFLNTEGGEGQRKQEIKEHWQEKGSRLVEDPENPGNWYDPGP